MTGMEGWLKIFHLMSEKESLLQAFTVEHCKYSYVKILSIVQTALMCLCVELHALLMTVANKLLCRLFSITTIHKREDHMTSAGWIRLSRLS